MPRPTKKPKQSGSNRPLTARQEKFCREYLIDLNQRAAAMRAGYSGRGADKIAHDLIRDPRVMAFIAKARARQQDRLDMKADDVVRRLAQIVTADARKLTSHHVGPCRYCFGIDHEYHWKTPREYREACEKTPESKTTPLDTGGYGYRTTDAPNPDCPECSGLGVPFVRFADTNNLSEAEAVLFEGVKTTRDGITFLMADKGRALERLADHLGIYNKAAGDDAIASFQAMFNSLLGSQSRAPLRKDAEPEPDGDA